MALFDTRITPEIEHVTNLILAVVVFVCFRSAAEVTVRDNLIPYSFTESFVKNEIGTEEFILEPLLFYLVGIINNATFQVPDISKAIML